MTSIALEPNQVPSGGPVDFGGGLLIAGVAIYMALLGVLAWREQWREWTMSRAWIDHHALSVGANMWALRIDFGDEVLQALPMAELCEIPEFRADPHVYLTRLADEAQCPSER